MWTARPSHALSAQVAPLLILMLAWPAPSGRAAQTRRSDSRPGIVTASDEQVEAERVGQALMHADAAVRQEAVRALGEASPALAVPALQQALLDSNARVRSAAVEALADIGGDTVVSALAFALVDPAADVREDAVYALGRVGGDSARAPVAMALADSDAAVREAARQLLAEWVRARRLHPKRVQPAP